MFRLMKLRPPSGWLAVGWELAIVTLGVLIALAAQQWAQERDWGHRVDVSRAALRAELAEHYFWSVEWRTVTPCMLAQVDSLRQRVVTSGTTLQPAPLFTDYNFRFVVRFPYKEYARSIYDAALADGAVQRFDSAFRRELNGHYAQVNVIEALTRQNGASGQELFGLSRPLQLDSGVRYEMLRTLDSLYGRIAFMDLLSGQLIDHVVKVGMVPPAARTRREVERFGTVGFCKGQRLPLRSLGEAMTPVSN